MMMKTAGFLFLLTGMAGFAMAVQIPEPAGSAASTLGLLAGAVLVIRSRRKK